MNQQEKTTLARRAVVAYATKFFARHPEPCKEFYGSADDFFATAVWYSTAIANKIGDDYNEHAAVKYATWLFKKQLVDDLEKIYHLGLKTFKRADGSVVAAYKTTKTYSLPTKKEDDGEEVVDLAAPEVDEPEFTAGEVSDFIKECAAILKVVDRRYRAANKPEKAIFYNVYKIYLESNRSPQAAAEKHGLTRAAWSARFANLEAFLRAEMMKRHPNA